MQLAPDVANIRQLSPSIPVAKNPAPAQFYDKVGNLIRNRYLNTICTPLA